jgi:hypothetical protein
VAALAATDVQDPGARGDAEAVEVDGQQADSITRRYSATVASAAARQL